MYPRILFFLIFIVESLKMKIFLVSRSFFPDPEFNPELYVSPNFVFFNFYGREFKNKIFLVTRNFFLDPEFWCFFFVFKVDSLKMKYFVSQHFPQTPNLNSNYMWARIWFFWFCEFENENNLVPNNIFTVPDFNPELYVPSNLFVFMFTGLGQYNFWKLMFVCILRLVFLIFCKWESQKLLYFLKYKLSKSKTYIFVSHFFKSEIINPHIILGIIHFAQKRFSECMQNAACRLQTCKLTCMLAGLEKPCMHVSLHVCSLHAAFCMHSEKRFWAKWTAPIIFHCCLFVKNFKTV